MASSRWMYRGVQISNLTLIPLWKRTEKHLQLMPYKLNVYESNNIKAGMYIHIYIWTEILYPECKSLYQITEMISNIHIYVYNGNDYNNLLFTKLDCNSNILYLELKLKYYSYCLSYYFYLIKNLYINKEIKNLIV